MSNFQDDTFRDIIGTIDEEGNRKYIYPKKPSGKFYDYRKWVSYILLLVLVANPFVKINGNQFMMFNVLERRYNIFGFPFWPEDFYIFVLFMIIGVVFVILFTVIFGRIFCGWICPQTIFMEMVFRRIEYWIDGSAAHQIKLKNIPWTTEKVLKRISKHLIFYIVAFLISNTFLAYVIGVDELFKIINDPISIHMGGFTMMLIFSGVFYFVYAWFREQVCLIACPYGRLQGVMLDKNSIVVAYDFKRGEPRGHIHKGDDPQSKGDCIDCGMCVKVCARLCTSLYVPFLHHSNDQKSLL